MFIMPRVLLLNADWSPLQFINDIRALRLIMKGRAEVISVDETPSMWDEHYTSVSSSFQRCQTHQGFSAAAALLRRSPKPQETAFKTWLPLFSFSSFMSGISVAQQMLLAWITG